MKTWGRHHPALGGGHDYRGEMGVSDEILKRTADAYRRIRTPPASCSPISMDSTR